VHESVSAIARNFSNLAILILISGAIALLVGLLAGTMPRRRRKALVNVVFVVAMVVGAILVFP